ncbi:MAG TPA: histidine kinase N-terminal 7TM domain-containing protein [Candidatus Paceibacterota bacterium]
MEITIYTILNWFISIIVGSFSMIIFYLGDKNNSTRSFSVLLLLTSIWSFSVSINILTNNSSLLMVNIASIVIRSSYFLGIMIATVLLFFSFLYPHNKKIENPVIIILVSITAILSYLLFFTDLIIFKLKIISEVQHFVWSYGSLWFLFDFYFIFCWVLGITIIFRKFLREKDVILRRHLKFLYIALIIGVAPPTILSILLPRLGMYDYDWLGPASGLVWVAIIAYSIAKHHLFNVKIIAIQIVTFGLWIFLLIRVFLAENSHDLLIESSLLSITVIFGVLLIRGTLHEIKQRRKMSELTNNLERAYGQIKELSEEIMEKEVMEDVENRIRKRI